MAQRESFGVLPTVLKARLKDAPQGAYVFFGPEELLKHFYLEKFFALIEKEGMADFNLVRLDFSGGATLDDLEREINTLPVMAQHRMVLCRGLSPAALNQDAAANLAALLEPFPDGLILILYLQEEEFKDDNATLKKKGVTVLKDAFTFCRFPLQSEGVLFPWARKILARDGLTIDDRALATLFRFCENRMQRARGELEKIACYCLAKSRTQVREEEVLLFARDSREFAVYNLCDAVLDGASGAVLGLFDNLMRQDVDPLLISGALARLFTNCLYCMEGASSDDLSKLTGLKDWQYRRYQRALHGKKKEDLSRALTICMDLDRNLKGSPLNKGQQFEKALLQMTLLCGGER